jgi:hypothetical protein
MNASPSLREQLDASLTGVRPKSAFEMREDAGRRYDDQIPADILGAIAALEQEERDFARTAGMTEADRLRFYAAKEWRLLKGEFRTFCRFVQRGTIKRSDECFQQLRTSARAHAYPRMEAWSTLRWQERRAASRMAAE